MTAGMLKNVVYSPTGKSSAIPSCKFSFSALPCYRGTPKTGIIDKHTTTNTFVTRNAVKRSGNRKRHMIIGCKSFGAAKMARMIFLLFSLFVTANCDQFSVVYAPKALEFRGHSRLNVDSLSDVFGASLGYSVSRPSEWDGLLIRDPFNLAKGAVVVVAEGIDSLNVEGAHNFELFGGSGSESIEELVQKTADHNGISTEIDLKESSGSFSTPLGPVQPDDDEIEPQYLKTKSNKADADFMRQLAFINGLGDLLVTSTEAQSAPSVYIVRVSLEALLATHEPSSKAIAEAKKLLTNAVLELQTAAEKAFDGDVVVGLITSTEAPLVRSKRQATPKQETTDYNYAKKYDSNYPVIFNIILWFSVVLTFSLLAISIAIATMDPGRDSIIYRMTSTRMKKDN
ncbi:ATPase H(+)-transporting accessory protein 2 [Uranotaenia lowii]|uniref:ATPase H(+)-transporting accessory protein 2 n=1 Tax=Uranotaenia lowii TaxID=190385 RepID=UPI00247B15D6|nr:ATPase H(+)-transporting accessory protein 2 [Uranotaenia lowii]